MRIRGGMVRTASIAASLLISVCALAAARSATAVPSDRKSSISFNRDIRPILSENCYACHGPDARQRKAKLRLDVQEVATKPAKSGAVAITPGDPEHSELIARIISDDADEHMPPVESGKKLNAAQVELLRRWVEEGAVYQGLWSLI